MNFRIEAIHFHVLPMRTRLPFRYGIAAMTSLPHLLVRADLIVNHTPVTGQSADGLPPKWFTKNPDTSFELDLAEMIASIQNAARIGRLAAENEVAFFPWWKDLHDEQTSWSMVREVPSLLAGFGVSLIERAVLDALCRAAQRPLWQILQSDPITIDLDALRPGQGGNHRLVSSPPANQLQIRHTVGLSDPLTDNDIAEDERLDDHLPHSLEESIRHYGLRSFKVKLSGQADSDHVRLATLVRILRDLDIADPSFTVDGNEHFHSMDAFRDYWMTIVSRPDCDVLAKLTRFIEQPVHRRHALDEQVRPVLETWKDRPPVIIDESDGSLADLPQALSLGYAGTSHKNCKGIVKGLANAALLRAHPGTIQSGEDLANIGPVALLQDFAMMSLLGIDDVERNGHHYFRGLSMHAPATQKSVLTDHPDLYQPLPDGTPALRIQNGAVGIQSVNDAGFGCHSLLDPSALEPLNDWIKRGGMAGC